MWRQALSVVVAAVDGAVLAVYLLLLASQPGYSLSPRVVAVSVLLGASAVGCLLSALLSRRRPALSDDLRLAATTGNIALGYLALASIGFPLLLAGVVLLATAGRHRGHVLRRLLGPAIMAALVLILMLATRS
jgi:hypothetical protein